MLSAMIVPLRRALRDRRKANTPSVQKAWGQVHKERLQRAERDASGTVIRLPTARDAVAQMGAGVVVDDGSEVARLYKYATTRAKELGCFLAIRAPCSDHEHGGPIVRDLPLPAGAPMPALRAPTTDPLEHIPRKSAHAPKGIATGRSRKHRSRSSSTAPPPVGRRWTVRSVLPKGTPTGTPMRSAPDARSARGPPRTEVDSNAPGIRHLGNIDTNVGLSQPPDLQTL